MVPLEPAATYVPSDRKAVGANDGNQMTDWGFAVDLFEDEFSDARPTASPAPASQGFKQTDVHAFPRDGEIRDLVAVPKIEAIGRKHQVE